LDTQLTAETPITELTNSFDEIFQVANKQIVAPKRPAPRIPNPLFVSSTAFSSDLPEVPDTQKHRELREL
jgi:hypothetical protein